MEKIAVVILNWNGRKMLEKFLDKVVRYSEPLGKVYVADNASTDDSVDYLRKHFPEVSLILLDQNYGFAEGYNRALKQIDSDYYLLLNSDVEVTDQWLEPLFYAMEENPEVAACQPKLLSYHNPASFEYAGASGGFIDYLGYPFCRGRILNTLELDLGQYDTEQDVFWATGAALMVRRDDYWTAGGLDGDFFAHMEEIDLCWRLKSMGKRILCIPKSVVYHVGGGTLPKENPRKTYLNFRNNLLMLYKNLPDEQVKGILFKRMILDGVAALQFLAKGDVGNFKAVYQAHQAYRSLKPKYALKREKVQEMARPEPVTGIFYQSILYAYLFRRIKTFDGLRRKYHAWRFQTQTHFRKYTSK